MDFYKIIKAPPSSKNSKYDWEMYPDFTYKRTTDLIVKGGVFDAFWNGKEWSKNQDDLIDHIDADVYSEADKLKAVNQDVLVNVKSMDRNSSGLMAIFESYCKRQRSSDKVFNQKVLFADHEIVKNDYATYKLPFVPTPGEAPAFTELATTLYDESELNKILWAMGALLTGKIAKIEKFLYLYGPKGTGKGTMIAIIQDMMGEYAGSIDLQVLTGSTEFATSQVQELPLLIDSDTDLSKIKKEVNLLKLTSHEPIMKRNLYQTAYPVTFKGLLITASNERYVLKNKDAGLARRPIVVHPTGRTVPQTKYTKLMNQVKFEYAQIAQTCIDKFEELGASYYRDEVDVDMLAYSDKIFDFVREYEYDMIPGITLKRATDLYKTYLEEFGWDSKGAKRELKASLHSFFREFEKEKVVDGDRKYNWYSGFKDEIAFPERYKKSPDKAKPNIIDLGITEPSTFDQEAKDWPAQYANDEGIPKYKWINVKTTLKDLDPKKLHYVKVPMNHIVLDFDLKDPKTGEKSLELNLRKASKYPETYTEVSKSGQGVHMHYYYDGDVGMLAAEIEPDVEIKVYSGNGALRRQVQRSNNLPIAHILSGLPFKEEKKVALKDIEEIVWTEKKLVGFVEAAMEKRHHSATKPECDFIFKTMADAKNAGVQYDLSHLKNKAINFALQSTNHKDYCLNLMMKVTWSTIKNETSVDTGGSHIVPENKLVFYDIEVYPNLFVVCWKPYGKPLVKWINPKADKMEQILEQPLVGFNNRKYDNHIIYNAYLGASNADLYQQSQGIINNNTSAMMQPAYGLSYADLYELQDVKQSLKKWEIQMINDGTLDQFTSEMIGEDISNLDHDEMELPWDQPVPENMFERVAEYCGHDVIWTEILWRSKHGQAPYFARKIMSELTDLPINTKTQTLAEKFLFGDDPRPQDKFVWYDLAEEFPGYTFDKFRKPQSDYMGLNPSEGGYVYSEPGVYRFVGLLDVESLHPHSLIAINYFGPYTGKFAALVNCRMLIKHGEMEEASRAFDKVDPELSAKLKPYLEDKSMAGALAHAMKIIINIVYGMTSASYDNKFRHPGNIDNIVAKRGALFMMMVKQKLNEAGFNVIHLKTDSFKIPDLEPNSAREKEAFELVQSYARQFGYNFDYEANFSRLALVNKAVIIGEHGPKGDAWMSDKYAKSIGHWEAIGAQYAIPYVYKKLFSGEVIEENDYPIFKSAKSAIFLGDTFVGKNANVYPSLTGRELMRTGEVDIAKRVQTQWLKAVDPVKGAAHVGIPVEEYERIVNNNFTPEMVTTYNSVTGTKGYNWELWNNFKGIDDLDIGYYEKLVEEGVENIYKVGDGNILFEGTRYERSLEPA